MKILIIRLSALGDTIHALPVAAALKRRIPGVEIGWIVEPLSAPLLINNPAVDRVFVLRKKELLAKVGRPWQWPAAITGIGALAAELRQAKYDVALDLQGLLKSAVWASLSGAKIRIGFAGAREGADRFLTHPVDIDYFGHHRHVVDHNLKLVEEFCRVTLPPPAASTDSEHQAQEPVEFPLPAIPQPVTDRMEKLLALKGTPDKSMVRNVVLIPGTTWSSKIWPVEKWCQLAKLLSAKFDFRVCIVGTELESGTNHEIASRLQEEVSGSRVLNLTGQTNLLELAALFARSELVVGADTGPLHLAAATGIPLVLGIYGSTPWLRNGPYGNQCATAHLKLWCQPCHQRVCPLSTTACLRDLPVEIIEQQISLLLTAK